MCFGEAVLVSSSSRTAQPNHKKIVSGNVALCDSVPALWAFWIWEITVLIVRVVSFVSESWTL